MGTEISIPLDTQGKHIGHVTIPVAGADPVQFPIASLRNGDGPCLFINAGTHGDEFEGQIALRKILRTLDATDIKGHLIAIPTLNTTAASANDRRSPLDGLDLNRSFPGDPDGSASQRIADFVVKEIVSRADAVVDLHAAGTAHEFIPHVMMHRREFLLSDALFDRTREAAQAFGMPAIFIVDEREREGMLDTVVEKAGKPFLCVELGFGGQTTPATVQRTETGIRNMLVHFGLMQGTVEADPAPMRAITGDAFIMAAEDGLFEFLVEIGDAVEAGQTIGYFHTIENANGAFVPLVSPKSGILAARRRYNRVDEGDFLAGIASAL
ncbi:MAG: succinylglutamate desuccinylase/aspartoacylase family protein [Sphingorhabdus sp.]